MISWDEHRIHHTPAENHQTTATCGLRDWQIEVPTVVNEAAWGCVGLLVPVIPGEVKMGVTTHSSHWCCGFAEQCTGRFVGLCCGEKGCVTFPAATAAGPCQHPPGVSGESWISLRRS